jgi:hypothetical protein
MPTPFFYPGEPSELRLYDLTTIGRVLQGIAAKKRLQRELAKVERPKYDSPNLKNLSMIEENLTQVDNDREYAIRKGKVLEKFKAEFHERYKHHRLYTDVLELLIRDADPYVLIEKLIEINDDLFNKYTEAVMHAAPFIPKDDPRFVNPTQGK